MAFPYFLEATKRFQVKYQHGFEACIDFNADAGFIY